MYNVIRFEKDTTQVLSFCQCGQSHNAINTWLILNISIMDIYNILSNEAGWAWVADFADDNMPLPLDDNTPHGEDILIALAKM